MTDLDFYAAFATTGRVCGLGVGSTPGEWASELGEEFLDDRQKRRLRRDYGLIEVSFQRNQDWECFGISVQIHRLAPGEGMIPARLREEHGPFQPGIPFHDLSSEIERRDAQLEELTGPSLAGHKAYKVASVPATIYVSDRTDDPLHRPGDVWSITVSG